MKKAVTTTALAVSLAASAGNYGYTPNRTPDPGLQRAFETSTQFWGGKGVQVLGNHAVKLAEIRVPGDVYTCRLGRESMKITPSSDSIGTYCFDTDTVVIAKESFDEWARMKQTLSVDPAHFADFIVSHELGHGIQGRLFRLDGSDSAEREQGADCLAGMANMPLSREEARAIFEGMGDDASTPVDDSHGTEEQRLAAFVRGQHADGNLELCAGSAFAQG